MEKRAAEDPESAGFALYGDRTVIFREREGIPTATGYMITRPLAEPEHRALLDKINPEALSKLGESYVLTTDGELPMRELLFAVSGAWKKISVFGDLANARARSRVPVELLRAFDAIAQFSAPARPWLPSVQLPSSVVVCLWPRQEAAEDAFRVPPSLLRKLEDRFQCVAVNPRNFERVYYGLIAQLKPGQLVRLADRNWAFAYRIRLPYQDDWDGQEHDHEVVPVRPRAKASGPERTARVALPSVVFDSVGPLSYNPEDSAGYALYADGLLIHGTQDKAVPSGYVSRRLSAKQYKALMSAIAPEAMLKLGDFYRVESGTDAPTDELHVWVGGRRKSVSVNGIIGGVEECRENPKEFDCKARAQAPPEYLRAYDAINASISGRARPWLPPYIELVLREHNPARQPETVAPWPAGWPSLDNARVYVNGERRLLLPASQFSRLKELVPNNYLGAAVEIEDALWHLQYHFPLPHEAMWVR